ncbi:MAG: hypothetical protein MI919_42545 [Holophagales bacterium]|nr:hypothetical protein [Holophagales bacterium]
MHPLRFHTFVLLAALLFALPSASFAMTEVQVPCTGVPVVDGASLLAAYNAIVGNAATSPFVVRPDPCLYDLGAATLTLRDFIDLIGLGRNDTIITSQRDRAVIPNQGTITVPAGVDAEVANLTIRNTETRQGYAVRNASDLFVIADSILEVSSDTDAVALYTIATSRIDSVVMRADTVGQEVIAARSVGLEDIGGNSVVTNTLITAGGNACTEAFGIILDGSDATILTTNVIVTCPSSTGIRISGGSKPKISNSRIQVAANGPGTSVGIDVAGFGDNALVTDTVVRANGQASSVGVRNNGAGSTLELSNVDARAEAGLAKVGLSAINGQCNVDRSTLEGVGLGGNSLSVGPGGNVRVGVSKLSGPRLIGGPAVCVGAYDGAYLPIPPTC